MADRSPSEAAAILRRLLAAIESGELTADTPRERGIFRQIEGAATALQSPSKERSGATGAGRQNRARKS